MSGHFLLPHFHHLAPLPDCKAQGSILEHFFFVIRDSSQRGIVCNAAQKKTFVYSNN